MKSPLVEMDWISIFNFILFHAAALKHAGMYSNIEYRSQRQQHPTAASARNRHHSIRCIYKRRMSGMHFDKKLPPTPQEERSRAPLPLLHTHSTPASSFSNFNSSHTSMSMPAPPIPKANKMPALSLNLHQNKPRSNLGACVSSEDLMSSSSSRDTSQDPLERQTSISSRRAGPPLTLNLRSNTMSNGNVSNIRGIPFDASLISPAQISASSLEDANFLFPVDDSDYTPFSSTIPIAPQPQLNRLASNVVIKQQSLANMMSTRLSSLKTTDAEKKTPDTEIPLRSLNRRNFKKLTLGPINTNADEKKSNFSDGKGDPLLKVKDPERKIDADELIKNIRNLELGLEYQMPIRADELIALKKLGSGQSGTVSKVLHLPTQKTMARKIVHLEAKEVIQSQIMRELRIMHECDSPFIIEFYGTFMDEGNVVICMEYADCGSLAHVFKITGPFPEFMLKHVAYSVLSGLIYLYDNHRIIHRDVKPSNVLLTSKGKIKLCDFGVSRELINSMADTFVGTSTYMSPERIQGGVYSVKGDVWSLGIMLYELASGNLAFSNDNNSGPTSILELLQRIVNEQPPSLSVKDGFSRELSDFVSLCLTKEKQRSSPWDLMNHPFLADFLEKDGMKVSAKYRGDIRKWAKNVRRVQKGKPIIPEAH